MFVDAFGVTVRSNGFLKLNAAVVSIGANKRSVTYNA